MEHSNPGFGSQGLLKTLSVLYFSFLISQVLFAVVAYIQQGSTYFDIENLDDVYIYAVPVLSVAAIVGSLLMFREQISALSFKETLKEKVSGYQSAYLVRMAFLEAASIFGIVAFFLKGNLFSLIFSGLIVLYFLTLRPTKENVERDLHLN